MQEFPPKPEDQVTLANWRTGPYNRWAFHHVREIIPTALISGAGQNAHPFETTDQTDDLLHKTFKGGDGTSHVLRDYLQTSYTDALVALHKGKLCLSWNAATCPKRSRTGA